MRNRQLFHILRSLLVTIPALLLLSVTALADSIDVTVPASFPVTVNADQSVTVSQNAVIANNGTSSVYIRKVEIAPAGDWKLASPTNASGASADSKVLGWAMTIDGQESEMTTSGNADSKTQTLMVESNDTPAIKIAAGQKASIKYQPALPSITQSISETTVANVIFTISADESAYAILYENFNHGLKLVFQRGDEIDTATYGTWVATYTGFETASYGAGGAPWYEYHDQIVSVVMLTEIRPASTAYWFYGFSKLTSASIYSLNVSGVTSMAGMYQGCVSMAEFSMFSGSTDNVTDVSNMFADCSSLTYVNFWNLSTSKVTNMQGMFSGCVRMNQLALSDNLIDTRNVTDMSRMFQGCASLKSLQFTGTNFTIGANTTCDGMFDGCSGLTVTVKNKSTADWLEKMSAPSDGEVEIIYEINDTADAATTLSLKYDPETGTLTGFSVS
jgi:surface protein